MAKQIDPKVGEVLREYGFGADAAWNCHGTWVVLHKVLEQIAAKAGVRYEAPSVLVAEREAAAVLVTGQLGDAVEWSIGEAVVGLNYKVSGKQAAYPFAMAEKRAKDRVILKLIGLHGLAYSEEEADDFKDSKPQGQGSKEEPPADDGNPFDAAPPLDTLTHTERKWVLERAQGIRYADNDSAHQLKVLQEALDITENRNDFGQFCTDNADKIALLIDSHYVTFKHSAASWLSAHPKQEAANG